MLETLATALVLSFLMSTMHEFVLSRMVNEFHHSDTKKG
jgi:hypothetical protein